MQQPAVEICDVEASYRPCPSGTVGSRPRPAHLLSAHAGKANNFDQAHSSWLNCSRDKW